MLGRADYGDYVRYLRDSTVVLRELAARDRVEDNEPRPDSLRSRIILAGLPTSFRQPIHRPESENRSQSMAKSIVVTLVVSVGCIGQVA